MANNPFTQAKALQLNVPVLEPVLDLSDLELPVLEPEAKLEFPPVKEYTEDDILGWFSNPSYAPSSISRQILQDRQYKSDAERKAKETIERLQEERLVHVTNLLDDLNEIKKCLPTSLVPSLVSSLAPGFVATVAKLKYYIGVAEESKKLLLEDSNP